MKKIISVILVAIISLSIVSCGSINKTEVSILWKDDGVVKVPNSLINSVERAMYIESISYTHYGAGGDADKQLQQAKECVEKGCSALLVNLIDSADAKEIVELAKAKEIPVVFFDCDVDDGVVASYDKCTEVNTDEETAVTVQAEQIGSYLVDNYPAVDRNDDGVVSYVVFADALNDSLTEKIAEKLKENTADIKEAVNKELEKAEKEALADSFAPSLSYYEKESEVKYLPDDNAGAKLGEIIGKYNDENGKMPELIITTDDEVALGILAALQKEGFNTDRLTTHCIPVFTVGADADYKSYVLENKPETEDEAKLKEYYESMKYLCDLTVVEEKDIEIMLYNTENVIAAGRLAGAVSEDRDQIAENLASVTRSLIKGEEVADFVLVPYVQY